MLIYCDSNVRVCFLSKLVKLKIGIVVVFMTFCNKMPIINGQDSFSIYDSQKIVTIPL